jgi:Tol biopolymer transport system component
MVRTGAAALGVLLAAAALSLPGGGAARSQAQVGGVIDWISWAPGATILFDGQGVHSISADGTRVQLMSARGGHGSWSPSRGSIAVTYAGWGIALAELGRRGLRRLTRAGNSPVWSPSGDRIAYAAIDGIRVVRRDGSNDHLAIPLRRGQNFTRENDWSPDGRRLVFSACLRGVAEGQVCPDAVYTAPLARPRARRRISPGGGTCPDSSPSGAVAYNSPNGIAVVAAPGAKPRIAVARAASCATWSPDGRLLAVEGRRSLIVARADARARRRLVSLPPLPTCCAFPQAAAPVWSPDGRMIAVARPIEGREATVSYRLYVVSVATGRARVIVRTAYG